MSSLLIPYIELSLDNQRLFDMAKSGYDLQYAKTLVGSLSGRALQVYMYVQLPIDFIYAAILATTYCLLLVKCFPRSYGLAYLLPLALLAFHWAENLCIYYMLIVGVSERVVEVASFSTQAKMIMGNYVLVGAAILGIIFAFFRFADKHLGSRRQQK